MLAVLAWARDNGIPLSVVTVGTCHVELSRPLPAAQPVESAQRPVRPGIYPQFGGDMLRQATADGSGRREMTRGDTDENGLMPVVGRG